MSISELNENGSVSVLSSIESDSLLVTSFDDGYTMYTALASASSFHIEIIDVEKRESETERGGKETWNFGKVMKTISGQSLYDDGTCCLFVFFYRDTEGKKSKMARFSLCVSQ